MYFYFYHLFIVKRSEIFHQISRSEQPDVTSEKFFSCGESCWDQLCGCPDLMLNQQDRWYKVTRIFGTRYHLPTQIPQNKRKSRPLFFWDPKFEWSLRFVIRNLPWSYREKPMCGTFVVVVVVVYFLPHTSMRWYKAIQSNYPLSYFLAIIFLLTISYLSQDNPPTNTTFH